MSLKWNENVTLKFLEEYKKHECLWNQNFTQYYNCCAKKQALRTIINKLNIPTLTETDFQQQIVAITKKYEEEQSKTLHSLCSGILYKSNLPWYSLMQDMLTKTFNDEKNNNLKVTICTNSIPDKKKKTLLNKKKKTKSNVLSPATEIVLDSCGHKIIKKTAPRSINGKNKGHNKKLKQKSMTEKYSNYVQCSSFGITNNLFEKTNLERGIENNTDQDRSLLETVCIREIKKRRDIPRINTLNSKSQEYSFCCRQNSENNHYATKDNFSTSKNMIPCPSYFNKQNNSDLNYNDYRYKDPNDQHRLRTRFVPCPNSIKPPDQLFSSCENRNSYIYSKNIDNYSDSERITCSNNFDKSAEIYPRKIQELPEHDMNLNKPSCIRNVDFAAKFNKGLSLIPEESDKNLCPSSEDQGVVQFFPKVVTKFENGIFEAYSQFKISIQCCEKSEGNKKVNQISTQETQTVLERKQKSVCTNSAIYDTKGTQHEGIKTLTKQTGMDVEDSNEDFQNTVCVSCDQTEELKDNPNDYILLMPGGKCVRLAKKICSKENVVLCQAVDDNKFDDEALSVCTEASSMTQGSVNSDTMTTPELLECVEKLLNINNNSEDIQAEKMLDSVELLKTDDRDIKKKESQCEACKNGEEGVDENFKFFFKKLFNKDISSSDCFPCLKEKIDKTGELTKTLLCLLKYALDLDCNTGNNTKGRRSKSKYRTQMIKQLCKCVKKLSEVEVETQDKSKNFVSKISQVEENKTHSKEVETEQEPTISRSVSGIFKNISVSKQTETENEPSISRSVNTIFKNIGISKLIETENRPSISRSVNAIPKNVGTAKQVETERISFISQSINTFTDESSIEIIQTHFENGETNTDFSILQKESGTNPMELIKYQDVSIQVKEHVSEKRKNTEIQNRNPIFVKDISENDSKKIKVQSSQSSISESEESRGNGCKRVCFKEKHDCQNPKREGKCGKECNLNYKWSKIQMKENGNYKMKNKILEKKLTEASRTKSVANTKIFFSDFRI